MLSRSWLALACWLSGCGSAFTAASGGPDAAGDSAAPAEASVARDTGLAEAALEASGTPVDAGSPEAGSHFCDGRPELFCADFDEGQSATTVVNSAPWMTSSELGGTFGLQTSMDVPSPPNALTASGGNSANVLVTRTLANPATARPFRARLEFNLKVVSAGSVTPLSASAFAAIGVGQTKSDGVVALAIGSGPTLAAVWAIPSDAGAGAGDGGTFGTANATGAFPTANTWAGRYAIEVTYAGTAAAPTACAQIYAGVTPLLSSCMPLPPLLANPKTFLIAIGDSAAGLNLTGNVELAFDNVTFNVI